MPMFVLLGVWTQVGKLRAVPLLASERLADPAATSSVLGKSFPCDRVRLGEAVPTSRPENALLERLLQASVIAY